MYVFKIICIVSLILIIGLLISEWAMTAQNRKDVTELKKRVKNLEKGRVENDT